MLWCHRFEHEIELLRANFAASRGQTMGKVTTIVVIFPIVLPLWQGYTSPFVGKRRTRGTALFSCYIQLKRSDYFFKEVRSF